METILLGDALEQLRELPSESVWMLAFALRDDGWYLRDDIIWSKPNCMPESTRDRCTKSISFCLQNPDNTILTLTLLGSRSRAIVQGAI